jgi:hypothetical protein
VYVLGDFVHSSSSQCHIQVCLLYKERGTVRAASVLKAVDLQPPRCILTCTSLKKCHIQVRLLYKERGTFREP